MAPGLGDYLSPSKIQDYFKDLQFPCSKEDLMTYAEDKHAPQQVLNAIQKMPDKQYNSLSEVGMEAVKSVI